MSDKKRGNTRFTQIEWAMWANMNALYAGVCIFFGGVVGATVETISLDSDFIVPVRAAAVTRWMVIPIGMFIFLLEYPRSARVGHKSVERPGQKFLAPLIQYTFVFKWYIVRFFLYIVLLIPCVFLLPSIFGGMCLLISCICYFIAAVNGEEWKAPAHAKKEPQQPAHSIPQAPSHPPPRPPPQLDQQPAEAPPSYAPPRPILT